MQDEQMLARALFKPKKKIWGNHAFFRDNLATIGLKSANIQSNVCFFFFNLN